MEHRDDVSGVSALPSEVHDVLGAFLCCELATVGRDGTALAWPAVPLYLPERGLLLLTTTIGFPVKARNIERQPKVSLLFSDATGSGLVQPAAVLVQGEARIAAGVQTWGEDLAAHWRRVMTIQPVSSRFTRPAPVRWFMDWYFMRLVIYVRPRRVSWWPDRAMAGPPRQAELPDVG